MDEEMDCDDRGVSLSHGPFTYNYIHQSLTTISPELSFLPFHQTLHLVPCLSVFANPIQCPTVLTWSNFRFPHKTCPKPFRHQINQFRSHEQVSDPALIRTCNREGVITTMITT